MPLEALFGQSQKGSSRKLTHLTRSGCLATKGSSCLRCLHDRCAGPDTTTTTIATTHHPTASSQDILTSSAPVNIAPKNAALVLKEACNTIVINTLPRVLLNTQVARIPKPRYPSITGTSGALG